jgi:FtsP/CotA-like multicopper oxidase with cupredoxin domain
MTANNEPARGDSPHRAQDLLAPFSTQLVRPSVLRPVRQDTADHYRVEVCAGHARLHANLPPTPLWTYAGSFPGPTIEVWRDRAVSVEWVNALTNAPHPIRTFIGAAPASGTSHARPGREPDGRWLDRAALPPWIVTHLHGGVTPAQSDGWPDNAILPGQSTVDRYPNRQRAVMLWYHDHAMGQTAPNVYAGLAGLYIVRDPEEAALHLPSGPLELPLLLQDRNLDFDDAGAPTGALLYKLDQPLGEFFGPFTLVNGTIWPYAEVPPVPHRLRLLNGSNARFYRLTIESDGGTPPPDAWLTLIGNDAGLLRAPAHVRGPLLLAPGERLDLIADFGACAGRNLVVWNDAPAPYPSGPADRSVVMQFRVGDAQHREPVVLPPQLSTVEAPDPGAATVHRTIRIEEDPKIPGMLRLNGKGFHDGIDEMPTLGDTEIWEFQNPTDDTHPMHLHLVSMQLVSRIHLDPAKPSAQPLDITDDERAPKDVIKCHPGQATRVAVRFGPYTGQYMYHCHMLEHEDHDMMRAYVVVAPGATM